MIRKLIFSLLIFVLTLGFCSNGFAKTKRSRHGAGRVARIYPWIRNERFAYLAMRSIASAEFTYQATYGNGDFGSATELRDAGLVPVELGMETTHGYRYQYTLVPRTSTALAQFVVQCTPLAFPGRGRLSFFIDDTAVLRGANKGGQPATVTDPPIDF